MAVPTKRDWEKLLAMGEAAKREEANGGDLAADIEKWRATRSFVNRYSSLARAFTVLDFLSNEHEEWCDLLNRLTTLGIEDDVSTHSHRMRFEAQHGRVVGRKRGCNSLAPIDGEPRERASGNACGLWRMTLSDRARVTGHRSQGSGPCSRSLPIPEIPMPQ